MQGCEDMPRSASSDAARCIGSRRTLCRPIPHAVFTIAEGHYSSQTLFCLMVCHAIHILS